MMACDMLDEYEGVIHMGTQHHGPTRWPVVHRRRETDGTGDGVGELQACMLSPVGKFLTGGYNMRSNPRRFRANKGFNSARELLRMWRLIWRRRSMEIGE